MVLGYMGLSLGIVISGYWGVWRGGGNMCRVHAFCVPRLWAPSAHMNLFFDTGVKNTLGYQCQENTRAPAGHRAGFRSSRGSP